MEDIGTIPALQTRMVRFARLLRDNDLPVGVTEVADAFRALGVVDALDADQVRRTLRPLFTSREREWRRFDELFDAFWLGEARYRRTVVRSSAGGAATVSGADRQGSGGRGTLADYFDWGCEGDAAGTIGGEGRAAGASRGESLAKADFGQITDPEEIRQLHHLARDWAERIRYRLSRRRRAGRRGEKLLLRRIFQRSVSTGGLPIKWFRSRRKLKPVRILVFVDVSGSMDNYSLFFTRFVYALTANFAKAEAFIFHTRLVHITGALGKINPQRMMEKLALISQGWSGGTRIGAALAEFNTHYATSFATPNTLAIIISDGFDTGPAERLGAELARLKRRAKRLVWLNPLLGRASYEPRAAGMLAALPHIDLFAPAHNLESLTVLEAELARL
ncbi:MULTISPECIES: VWA domain-containing protein [Rhodomicrobium]|uniref:vWA domain-containing protein n=1 Tax=Rhodomicrobium TaxID=1068 RepID=UPI000F738457|nr:MULTISPECIES: VWA domain-containing protein [Rhodomicrobium]